MLCGLNSLPDAGKSQSTGQVISAGLAPWAGMGSWTPVSGPGLCGKRLWHLVCLYASLGTSCGIGLLPMVLLELQWGSCHLGAWLSPQEQATGLLPTPRHLDTASGRFSCPPIKGQMTQVCRPNPVHRLYV